MLREGSYKAAKGLIRIKIRVSNDKIRDIQISGDFFMYPEDMLWELESVLLGTIVTRKETLSRVRAFYEKTGVVTPGVTPEDFVEAIMISVKGSNS